MQTETLSGEGALPSIAERAIENCISSHISKDAQAIADAKHVLKLAVDYPEAFPDELLARAIESGAHTTFPELIEFELKALIATNVDGSADNSDRVDAFIDATMQHDSLPLIALNPEELAAAGLNLRSDESAESTDHPEESMIDVCAYANVDLFAHLPENDDSLPHKLSDRVSLICDHLTDIDDDKDTGPYFTLKNQLLNRLIVAYTPSLALDDLVIFPGSKEERKPIDDLGNILAFDTALAFVSHVSESNDAHAAYLFNELLLIATINHEVLPIAEMLETSELWKNGEDSLAFKHLLSNDELVARVYGWDLSPKLSAASIMLPPHQQKVIIDCVFSEEFADLTADAQEALSKTFCHILLANYTRLSDTQKGFITAVSYKRLIETSNYINKRVLSFQASDQQEVLAHMFGPGFAVLNPGAQHAMIKSYANLLLNHYSNLSTNFKLLSASILAELLCISLANTSAEDPRAIKKIHTFLCLILQQAPGGPPAVQKQYKDAVAIGIDNGIAQSTLQDWQMGLLFFNAPMKPYFIFKNAGLAQLDKAAEKACSWFCAFGKTLPQLARPRYVGSLSTTISRVQTEIRNVCRSLLQAPPHHPLVFSTPQDSDLTMTETRKGELTLQILAGVVRRLRALPEFSGLAVPNTVKPGMAYPEDQIQPKRKRQPAPGLNQNQPPAARRLLGI